MATNGVAGLGLLGDPDPAGHLRAARPTSTHGGRAGPAAAHHPISGVPAPPRLKDGGLVISRAEGTRRIYRLNPDGVTALRAYLDRIWEEALTAFAKATQAAPTDLEQEDQ